MSDKVYKLSEVFVSQQGEGMHMGTMMTFIRLAGCSVGKPYPKKAYDEGLPIYTERCTLYDGRSFACDTDYRVKEKKTVDQIIKSLSPEVRHVCITGGEPLIHDLTDLFNGLTSKGFSIHLETSGSILFTGWESVWVTVSPKKGILDEMIRRADEIKLLIDDDFDVAKLPELILTHPLVYLQPVNDEHTVRADNLKLVMDLQKRFPRWKISLQLHKILEHFIEERVR